MFDPNDYYCLPVSGVDIYLSKKALGSFGEDKELMRLKLKKDREQANRIKRLLDSDFSLKAPKEIVDKEHKKLRLYQRDILKREELLYEYLVLINTNNDCHIINFFYNYDSAKKEIAEMIENDIVNKKHHKYYLCQKYE